MTDVLVVGGGIIGLTAARRLQQRGARVTIWTAHDVRDTVSSIAAAVWYPSHTERDDRILRWASTTYDEFARQAAAGVPGVLLRRTRMVVRRPPAALPWWAAGAPGSVLTGGELHFTAPLVEMDTYLAGLRQEVAGAGATLVRRRAASLGEALDAAPVVVNATGLAAGRLCDDPAVYPARGHIVLADNPGLDVSVRDEDNPAGITYVHPRTHDVVLGGTFDAGNWSVDPDPAEAAAIVRRCLSLVPELSGVRIRGSRVGLRPARHGGPRVEADGRIIHAYGHGGAGMTLSWGCADEVAALAYGATPCAADASSR
nr:FAD-dependent oxidoreductase [uncultured Actinoplanes sp.]